MGHTAFQITTIIEKLPVKVESLDGWGNDRLVVGTSEGSLLVYNVEESAGGDELFIVSLIATKKRFSNSKKIIQQLNIIEQLNIVISLSDGYVFVHTLPSFDLLCKIAETRGANIYAIDLMPSGKLMLCAALRRKLVFMQWDHAAGQFIFMQELAIPDVAKSLALCGTHLFVGFKKEYSLINLDSGKMTNLIQSGGGEPTCTILPEQEVLLGKDIITLFMGYDGKPTRRYGLSWTEPPIRLGYSFPYVLGILPRYVEVRTIETQTLVQAIPVKSGRLLSCKRVVYVASDKNVYRLIPVALLTQVQALIDGKQYEEALNLAERITDLDEGKKSEKIRFVKTLYAYDLFAKGRFEDSMTRLYDLDIDPPQVIGMFPDLLPINLRQAFKYPIDIPHLEGVELENALMALIDFLAKVRRQDVEKQARNEEVSEESNELRLIIDTTLLKAYLRTNKSLVGSLLRIPNHCHVEECENVLIKHQRWADLVALYKGKSLHRKSLDLLTRLGQQENGSLTGIHHTIWYLQSLGAQFIDLIVEFSKWILQADPQQGLTIFTESSEAVDPLPPSRVLKHLEAVAPMLVEEYLEHVIFGKKSTAAEFHDQLVFTYLETALAELKLISPEATEARHADPVRASDEEGALGDIRRKLLRFLGSSEHYNPDRMLSRFPFQDLLEERAVLLSRIGRHEQALLIYAHKLGSSELAEEYCDRNYDAEKEESRDVYLSLLRVYLDPEGSGGEASPRTRAALDLLIKHHARINTPKALELLPPSVSIGALLPFFESVLEDTSQQRRHNGVVKNLLKTENLQVRERLITNRSRVVKITEDRQCPVCRKRFQGNSVFACYPNNTVVHFICYKDKTVCPVTGQRFAPAGSS